MFTLTGTQTEQCEKEDTYFNEVNETTALQKTSKTKNYFKHAYVYIIYVQTE